MLMIQGLMYKHCERDLLLSPTGTWDATSLINCYMWVTLEELKEGDYDGVVDKVGKYIEFNKKKYYKLHKQDGTCVFKPQRVDKMDFVGNISDVYMYKDDNR